MAPANEDYQKKLREVRNDLEVMRIAHEQHNNEIQEDDAHDERQCRICRLHERHHRTFVRNVAQMAVDANDKCTICQDDYDHASVAFVCPCMHTFHKQCIERWQAHNHSCPNCMAPPTGFYKKSMSTLGRRYRNFDLTVIMYGQPTSSYSCHSIHGI